MSECRDHFDQSANRAARWAQCFLHWYCPCTLIEEIEGDLLEQYAMDLADRSVSQPNARYISGVLRFCNPVTFRRGRELADSQPRFVNSLGRWKNYFKIGARSIWKYKTSNAVHIFGLAVALTCCLLIGLFVHDEFQYDKFVPDSENIYRVYAQRGGESQSGAWASSSPMIGPQMLEEMPEVRAAGRLYHIRQKLLFKSEENELLEENGFYAEQATLELFGLPFKYGSAQAVFEHQAGVVLSSELATKYFGTADPIGQTIRINSQETAVTGVLDELPQHFHLQFNFLLPFAMLEAQVDPERMRSWVWQDFYTYIKLSSKQDLTNVEDKLPGFIERNAHPSTKQAGFHYYVKLQEIGDIHLKSSHLQSDIAVRGNYHYTIALAGIGLFLLVIASINFINLSTARSIRRAREVGVRKVSGARHEQIMTQFLTESILVYGISMTLAIAAGRLALPWLNQFTDKAMNYALLLTPAVALTLCGLVVITGVLAGLYPAILLSHFSPIEVLRSSVSPSGKSGSALLRRGLVVTQLAISSVLIVCLLAMYSQLSFLSTADMGFARDQLIYFPMRGKLFRNTEMAKNQFVQLPNVRSASTCFGIPGDIIAGDQVIIPHQAGAQLPARLMAVDYAYIETMKLDILAGRDFSQQNPTDEHQAFIINETAVSNLGYGEHPEDAVGKALHWQTWADPDSIKRGRVVGVVKDFHIQSLYDRIETVVLHIDKNSYWKMLLALNGNDLSSTIADIKRTWNAFETGYPIDYQFVDESFGAMYQAESRLGDLLLLFTIIAISIACIGAFTVMADTAERRKTELGVRRILGAAPATLLLMLSREFFILVSIALLIGLPVGWYLLDSWLSGFAYCIDLSWTFFALASASVLVIVLATISCQAVITAYRNPVDAIRDE